MNLALFIVGALNVHHINLHAPKNDGEVTDNRCNAGFFVMSRESVLRAIGIESVGQGSAGRQVKTRRSGQNQNHLIAAGWVMFKQE